MAIPFDSSTMYEGVQTILDIVQPVISGGYGIVAALLGDPCDWFRPLSNNDPLAQINHQGVLQSMFDDDPKFSMQKPRQYKNAQMYAAMDRTNTLPGDYLVDQTDSMIYFINSEEIIVPTGVVYCNNTVSIYRPTAIETGGFISNRYPNATANVYGGNVNNLGDPIAANWPVSMLAGSKGERDQITLPNQSRTPWYAIKMPLIPGVLLESDDLIIDKNGVRFLISLVEITELGYNLTADQVMV